MKGIILSGGGGTRLYPLTYAISKQMLPVYDKPMIYYPLNVLLQAGIKDILIISTKEDTPRFMYLLGTGEELGIHIEYKIQPRPEGLAQAFILGKNFIGDDDCALILGDNIFFGENLADITKDVCKKKILKQEGAVLFAYQVPDPNRFGVVEFDNEGKAITIEEKPISPKSNWAVTGLYFYNNNVVDYSLSLKPSSRGELEITDLNNIYLKNKKVEVVQFPSSVRWLDAGTHDSLLKAGSEVMNYEMKHNTKAGCIEETVFNNGWITKKELLKRAEGIPNLYGEYLKKVALR